MSFILSDEQEDVILKAYNGILKSDKKTIIKVLALAGSGKTTILVKSVEKILQKKKINGLYLAFNDSIIQGAKEVLPEEIEIKTVHALAFYYIGRCFKGINLNVKNLTVRGIGEEYEQGYLMASKIHSTFNDFCKTPFSYDDYKALYGTSTEVMNIVKNIYEDMRNGARNVTFDFVLKYFLESVENESISLEQRDILLFDEAQDSNLISLAICYAIPAKVKIIAGDKHQKIYSFNKSVNGLLKKGKDSDSVEHICYLTRTYRFHKKISTTANRVLQFFKGEKEDKLIKAFGKKDDKNYTSFAYISRTNTKLIDKMIECKKEGLNFVTVRDPKNMFKIIESVYYLYINDKKKISDYTIKKFNDFEELKDYAKEAKAIEILSAIAIVEKNCSHIEEIKEIAISNFENPRLKDDADIYLATGHSSKGLEFDYVEIAPDFLDFSEIIHKLKYNNYESFIKDVAEDKIKDDDLMDEFNLFYVVITRAKKYLRISNKNFKYLEMHNAKDIANEVNFNIKKLQEKENVKKIYKKWK